MHERGRERKGMKPIRKVRNDVGGRTEQSASCCENKIILNSFPQGLPNGVDFN